MSAENLHGEGSAAAAEVRTGPRHAAPKKPLFNRFHMPAGKAIAMAAMPTAVLMGIGFTPTLALADDAPTAKSLTADEYKDCIAALDGASPSASASPSSSPDDSDDSATATPSPSASSGSGSNSGGSSSDSGSGDKATPTPTPSASASKEESSSSSENSGSATATPSPSASASDDGNLLTEIGDAITGIFTGGSGSGESPSASPTPTPSASASKSADDSAGDTAKETTEKVTDTVKDTVKDTTDTASKAAEDTTKAVEDATKAAEAAAAADATASPSPSASSTTDPEDCPAATDEVGDTEPGVTVADKAWTLKASSLLLKGADYQGVVKVRTASGQTKKVLKYVISGGTDIGDLHQTVTEQGTTYHVQAGKGTTSTITGGKTIMYTESISGNLLGLIPITFSPDSPPPLNIPLIYFTNVTVQQAAQYGGTLTVPGMRQYSES
ncbi:MAG: hypothetical protein JF598_09290 [Streptomyces sp.]|nr:hypothetical protein [Streptomyces sp.]